MARLRLAHVAVFGLGGVGGAAAEALARGGIGALDLIDNDTVDITNINRQIIALHSVIGQYKTDVCAARVRDIAPDCTVRTFRTFFLPETASDFDFTEYDYVVDAIDTVTGKLELIERAQAAGAKVISAMGAGNRVDPSKLQIADLYETSGCPLARTMRRECKKCGIEHLKVVYSTEEPMRPLFQPEADKDAEHVRRDTPGSVSFVPPVAGYLMAGEVIRDLSSIEK